MRIHPSHFLYRDVAKQLAVIFRVRRAEVRTSFPHFPIFPLALIPPNKNEIMPVL
jgi:hypothetical protein